MAHTAHSQSNLIDVNHVGVSAELQPQLKPQKIMQPSSSSTDAEAADISYITAHAKGKYKKFSNDTAADTQPSTSESSKVLYEMRAIRDQGQNNSKITPSKIEFQRYNKLGHHLRRPKQQVRRQPHKVPIHHRHIICDSPHPCQQAKHCEVVKKPSFFQRLYQAFANMGLSKEDRQPHCRYDTSLSNGKPDPVLLESSTTGSSLGISTQRATEPEQPNAPQEAHIGIYPFDRGCKEYLSTNDHHPELITVMLAERATVYATRFWAEVFGSLHIAVIFIVTFMLQTYRFVLFSLFNTLIVGMLNMTSDYCIKPLISSTFNGFLQPPMTLAYNVLNSIREILEPIAEAINNFARPVATVGRSLRFVQVRKFEKNV